MNWIHCARSLAIVAVAASWTPGCNRAPDSTTQGPGQGAAPASPPAAAPAGGAGASAAAGAGMSAADVSGVKTVTPEQLANLAWDGTQSKYVTCALMANGGLYVGTEDGGLWWCDGQGWKQVHFNDGSDGTDIRSLAVDKGGRVWVGRGWHGVSVFNGQKWATYDAPFGPLGHRVFRIAVSPIDGSVWLATELGLTQYDVAKERWRHITRAEGLPSDQINALAFDEEGTLFVATQCEGLAIGRAAEGYKTWKHVEGPDRLPAEITGSGLPSGLMNDVLPVRGGIVYAATCGGLAVSKDHGETWTFYRGRDSGAKVENRTGGPPDAWTNESSHALLAEDYVTHVAEDGAGNLWVGHRSKSVERFSEASLQKTEAITRDDGGKLEYASCFARIGSGHMVVGTYGTGWGVAAADGATISQDATASTITTLPSPYSVSAEERQQMLDRLGKQPPAIQAPAYWADDWVTRGDGAGRYGWQAMAFPFYGTVTWQNQYQVEEKIGPHHMDDVGGPYTYFAGEKPAPVLYIPNSFKRYQGEWNDGAFDAKYPRTYEGPDLWFRVTLPDGLHRVTVFFINEDVHRKKINAERDFTVEVKDGALSMEAANFATPLARTRACEFYDPVYKSFMLPGDKSYWIKVGRNYSFVGKANGVFIDRVPPPEKIEDGKLETMPVPMVDALHWGPPPMRGLLGGSPALDDAAKIYIEAPDYVTKLQAYAIAAKEGALADALKNWRWHLHLWEEPERLEFCQQMDAAYAKFQPQLNENKAQEDKPRTSMVDAYRAQREKSGAGPQNVQ